MAFTRFERALLSSWLLGCAFLACGDSSATGGTGAVGGGGSGSGAGGDGGGGTGAAEPMNCTPGETEDCYSGPAGTADEGACEEGTRSCLPDGSGFGECEGEILPSEEDCTTPEDDDCDGVANEENEGCVCLPSSTTDCFGGPPAVGGVGSCTLGSMTCNADGKGYGACSGDVLPVFEACDTPGSDENCDGVDACTGTPVWARRYGYDESPEANHLNALAVDADGNVVITGQFGEGINFGGGLLKSSNSPRGYIAKFSANGTFMWNEKFGNIGASAGYGVAIDHEGAVLLTGTATGSFQWGGQSSSGGSVFMAKLEPDGTPVWTKRFGGNQVNYPNAVAFDSANNVIFAGELKGTVDFGGGALSGAQYGTAYVVKFDTDGGYLWSKLFAGTNAPWTLAVDSNDDIILGGSHSAGSDFGGGVVPTAGTFLVKLNSAGDHVWGQAYTWGDANQYVVTDDLDNIIMCGNASASDDLGAGPIPSAGIFLRWLDGEGSYLQSNVYGGGTCKAIALDAAGNLMLAGHFYSPTHFGGATLTGSGNYDAFLVKFDGGGTEVWSKAFSGVDAIFSSGYGLDADGLGNILVGGHVAGPVDFGVGSQQAIGYDIWFAKYAP